MLIHHLDKELQISSTSSPPLLEWMLLRNFNKIKLNAKEEIYFLKVFYLQHYQI